MATSIGRSPRPLAIIDPCMQPGVSLAPGTAVGRYVLIEPLGAGGAGVVYKAYDPELDRVVAVKLIAPEQREGEALAAAQARLLREAQALARLADPNVVTVHDAGSYEGAVFLAMEYVRGQTLRRWLGEATRSWREVLDVFMAAGRGLAAAHQAGLIHRDFKPDNVIIGDDGRVRVLDFGLARRAAAPATVDVLAITRRGGPTPPEVTRTGALVGTPLYMAPEQYLGRDIDPRTDQFSFCVALHEALYGVTPFEGTSVAELAADVTHGRMRADALRRRVPSWLRRILQRGLSVDPKARFADMKELLAALGRGRRSRGRHGLLAATVVVVAAVAAILRFGGRPAAAAAADPCAGQRSTLDGAWDDDARARLRAAFVGGGRVDGEGAFRAVEQALDGYRGRLIDMRVDACEDTHVRHEQSAQLLDLRMACLERRAGAMKALIDFYVDGLDTRDLPKATLAAHRLPAVDDCDDTEMLLSAYPLPSDPARRARIGELGEQTARLAGLMEAGQYADCARLATEIRRQALALSYPPIEAEALHLLGVCTWRGGDPRVGRDLLNEAIRAAARARDDDRAAEIWADLLYATVQAETPRAALDLRPAAEAAVARAGGSRRWQAKLAGTLGLVLGEHGDYEQAMAQFDRALALTIEQLGSDHPDVALIHNNAAVALYRAGRRAEARTHLERAIATWERHLGARHPRLGHAYNTLGASLYDDGMRAEARAAWERALDIRRSTLGPRHPYVARVLPNLGWIEADELHFEAAQRYQEESLSIQFDSLGPNHLETASTMSDLGFILLERGQVAEAIRSCEMAEQILDRNQVAATHAQRRYVQLCLGGARLRAGQAQAALPLLERAASAFEGQKPYQDLAAAQRALAEALWQTRVDRSRALVIARQALVNYVRASETPRVRRDLERLRTWIAQREARR